MSAFGERIGIRQAEPSLAGLVASTRPDDDASPSLTVYPWVCLGRPSRSDSAIWRVYDHEGHQALEQGRPVLLRVPNDHRSRIARRAQSRAFRHAWKRGVFALHERYRVSRVAGWVLLAITAGLAILAATALAQGVRDTYLADGELPLPPEYHTLTTVVVISMAVLLGLVAWLFICIGFHLATKPYVVSARFDNRGLQATLRSANLVSIAWTELQDVKHTGVHSRVRFRDGTTLWFPGARPRTILALRSIEAELKPEAVARAQRRLERIGVRGTVLAILSAAAAGLLVRYVNRMLATPIPWLVVAGCVLFLVLIPIWAIRLAPLIQRLSDRQHKRRARQTRSGRR